MWMAGGSSKGPGLAMSRSIGDSIAGKIGVIPDPVITEHRITKEDKFIIIASDGLWEFLSSQACVETVSNYWAL